MKASKKDYRVDIDFYSMELVITAKNASEARKIAKNKIKRGVGMIKHINHIYIDRI